MFNDTIICVSEEVSYGAGVTDIVSYAWVNQNQSTIGTERDISIDEEGFYQLEVTNDYCSSMSNEFFVDVVSPSVSVRVDPNRSILLGESALLLVNEPTNDYQYQWFSNSNLISEGTSLVVQPNETEIYRVIGSVNGCDVSTLVEVEVVLPIVVPSMFTPNGDGMNDSWEISGIETYDNYVLRVYNRWGTVVFKSINNYEGWDGKLNAEDVPFGVYYYVIELEGFDSVAGSVTIMR